VNNDLQQISISQNSEDYDKLSYLGYFLSFKNDNLQVYAEGDIPFAVDGYYDATAKDNTQRDNLSIDGKGIKV
jgi:hypothetical protein